MNRPNFFVVGAPKCGTTALHAYLNHHPEIFLPYKEIHYFGKDLGFRYRTERSQSDYLRLFDNPGPAEHLGDASVWYLFSRSAAREIHDFSPDAKIIVMLRDPVEMMYALHSQLLYAGDQDLPDFAAALEAGKERREGRRIPRGARLPKALVYRDAVRYAGQLERYFDHFERSQIHVILFDDLKRSPETVYQSTLRFLGADQNHRPDLLVVNPNTRRRSRRIAQFMAVPYPALRNAVRLLLPSRRLRRRLGKQLSRLNTVIKPRQPLDTSLRQRLVEEMTPEILRLQQMIGRDLSSWLEAGD